jgi:hypothetical protein
MEELEIETVLDHDTSWVELVPAAYSREQVEVAECLRIGLVAAEHARNSLHGIEDLRPSAPAPQRRNATKPPPARSRAA